MQTWFVVSAKVTLFIGQILTHFKLVRSPNNPAGQISWQRFVVSSAYTVGVTVGHLSL